MKINYKNNLSIPFLIGMWCFLYALAYIGIIVLVLIDGDPYGEPETSVYFTLFSIGSFLVFISSPAVMMKRNWGRKLSSFGFLLVIIVLSTAFLRQPSHDTFAMVLLFILPVIPLLLLLHSEKFIENFPRNNKKAYNEPDSPDTATLDKSSTGVPQSKESATPL